MTQKDIYAAIWLRLRNMGINWLVIGLSPNQDIHTSMVEWTEFQTMEMMKLSVCLYALRWLPRQYRLSQKQRNASIGWSLSSKSMQ